MREAGSQDGQVGNGEPRISLCSANGVHRRRLETRVLLADFLLVGGGVGGFVCALCPGKLAGSWRRRRREVEDGDGRERQGQTERGPARSSEGQHTG